jgi:hypothetical protein
MKTKFKLIPVILCLGLLIASQAVAAPNAAFSEIGFIQRATLNAAPRPGQAAQFRGGTITVNGKTMVVPDNTIVQFPAATYTWPQIFNSDPITGWGPVYGPDVTPVPVNAPAPAAGFTGLALNDPIANHFPAYEVSLVGNIITDFVAGTQTYVVGLIAPAAQIDLHNHGGYINFIHYASGRFRVGGIINDANCTQAGVPYGGPLCSGSLVEINDPVGRWGKLHSPDKRLSTDTDNPTVTAATGYPVCIPRVEPPAIDADCPIANRPLVDPLVPGVFQKIITMPPGETTDPTLTTGLNPWKMAPLVVGDWVDVAGSIFKIDPTLVGNAVNNQYISAHTVGAHLGLRTSPSSQPVYVQTEEFIFGVGDRNGNPTVALNGTGPIAAGAPGGIAQETSTRAVLVAFCTDPTLGGPNGTNTVGSILGVYYNPNGNVDLIPFPINTPGDNVLIDDPVRGRIRWTTSNNGSTLGVLANAAGPGKFYREYILRLNSGPLQLPTQANGLPGLMTGQYFAPMFEYLFGEGTNFGEPMPPFNFNDLGFLFVGEGAAGPGGGAGPLRPFPAFQ